MTCSYFINDYVVGLKSFSAFYDSDFTEVKKTRELTDQLLINLSKLNEDFKGKYTWADLDPSHYRIMLIDNLNSVSALPEKHQSNPTHPIVKSFNFIVMNLILSIEESSKINVETIKINRYSKLNVTFEFNASLDMETAPNSANKLRLVVDNSKNENLVKN